MNRNQIEIVRKGTRRMLRGLKYTGMKGASGIEVYHWARAYRDREYGVRHDGERNPRYPARSLRGRPRKNPPYPGRLPRLEDTRPATGASVIDAVMRRMARREKRGE